MKAELVSIERILPDPNQPRTSSNPEQKSELAASVMRHGIKVPLIGYLVPGGVMLGDGHCRLEAARVVGLLEVPVIVFPQKPCEAELLETQLTINGHRHALNPVDEYEAFVRLAKLRNWSLSELAAGLAVSNAEVTRVMAIGKLTQEERQLVQLGKISKSGAYALTRMSPEQRSAMASKAAAGEVTRDQLNSKARRKKEGGEIKTRRINCPLGGGNISVQSASGLTLLELIELLEELIRECRKARSQNLNISTVARVLRDRSLAADAG